MPDFNSTFLGSHLGPLNLKDRNHILLILAVSVILGRSLPSSAWTSITTGCRDETYANRDTKIRDKKDQGFIARWRNASRVRDEERRIRDLMTPLNTPMLEKKMTDLYIPQLDGSRTLLVPYRGRVSKVRITPTPLDTYLAHRPYFPKIKSTASTIISGKKRQLGVNKEFIRQLRAVLMIVLPKAASKEGFLLALHTMFLIFRTLLSVAVARLDGRIVRDLVSADGKGFTKGLCWWFALSVPATYTNAMIRYLQSKLSLAFRTRLTRYVHDLYLNDKMNYYKLGLGLDGGMGVYTGKEGEGEARSGGSADQYITSDIAKFCDTLAALYGNIGKPTLDLLIFTTQLSRSLGPLGTIGLFANYFITAKILSAATPAFGMMKTKEAGLEAEYRSGVAKIGRDAEEIAFYHGGPREHQILWTAYKNLIRHVNEVFKVRIAYNMTEDFVIKYMWSAAGYTLMSIPILFRVKAPTHVTAGTIHSAVAIRTESYISNRRLLLSLADAGGRLMYSGKDISELVGYTSRVYSLLASLYELDSGDYLRDGVETKITEEGKPIYLLSNVHGKVIIGPEHIAFQDVPIIAPSGGAAGIERGGEVLLKGLTLEVKAGQHMLVTGANGVGKTSLARLLARLWPVWEGVLERPVDAEIFFVPQRPYLSIGSLRDQVIYPHTYAAMKSAGRTDTELLHILRQVHLAYLPDREGGWETRKEWKDVLSGGEKQRIQMARLFYHQPKFAVLDECTSAVSSDVEGSLYTQAKEMGMTLFTISHRPSLLKYHSYRLNLTPEISSQPYTITALTQPQTEAEATSLDNEIVRLEKVLSDVGEWEARLGEVKRRLAGRREVNVE